LTVVLHSLQIDFSGSRQEMTKLEFLRKVNGPDFKKGDDVKTLQTIDRKVAKSDG